MGRLIDLPRPGILPFDLITQLLPDYRCTGLFSDPRQRNGWLFQRTVHVRGVRPLEQIRWSPLRRAQWQARGLHALCLFLSFSSAWRSIATCWSRLQVNAWARRASPLTFATQRWCFRVRRTSLAIGPHRGRDARTARPARRRWLKRRIRAVHAAVASPPPMHSKRRACRRGAGVDQGGDDPQAVEPTGWPGRRRRRH